MRGLFFKVFIIFWVAQSLIFVISTAVIVRRHFNENPEVAIDAFDSSLQSDANQAAQTYETGGCDAVRTFGVQFSQAIALEDATGQLVCNPGSVQGVAKDVSVPERIIGSQVGQQYIWKVPPHRQPASTMCSC